MSEFVRVRVPVIRETARAFLLDLGGGRQEWVPRKFCHHASVAKWEVKMARWLAEKLSLQYVRNAPRPRHALPDLVREATISDTVLITPKPNRPQQQAAFDKLYQFRYFALFMQVRAGKTKVAIDIVCNHFAHGHIDRVLWLCPLSVIPTAQREWAAFAVCAPALRFVGLESVSGCAPEKFAEIENWCTPQTAVVIDESQMIKNADAKRSRRLNRLLAQAAVKGILTGTPITQNVQDLYNQIKALDWRIYGYKSRYAFERMHLVMSEKIPGLVCDVINVDYLQERIKPFVFEWKFDYSTVKNLTREKLEMGTEQRYWYGRCKKAVLARLYGCTESHSDILMLFAALAGVMSGYVSARLASRVLGKETPALRLPSPKLDALRAWVEGTDGLKIVWCSRLSEIELIAKEFPQAAVISGAVPPAERHLRLEHFKHSADGLLAAMMQTARRGINLAECCHVAYYSAGFDYEAWEQSMGRTLLPEKTDVCHYTDWVFNESLDTRIRESHAKKSNIVRDFLRLLKEDRAQAVQFMETL